MKSATANIDWVKQATFNDSWVSPVLGYLGVSSQMPFIYKKLHDFTAYFAGSIEKYIKAVIYCVRNVNRGMAVEKTVVLHFIIGKEREGAA